MTSRRAWLALLFLSPLCAAAQKKANRPMQPLLQAIPVEVREYLSASDGLGRAGTQEQYPDLQRTLRAASTREAILRYLASDEPWREPAPGFLINVLAFLQDKPTAAEAPTIEKYFGYSNPWVRVRAAEYLVALYLPARNRAAMVSLWQRMLNDDDEIVRVQAARWIVNLKAGGEMRPFLDQWRATARQKHRDTAESYTLLENVR